jgi:fructokinase
MGFNVLAIGEILWDLLPAGRQLGGAPANFAIHARALGAEARLISRVGDDPLGAEILERLARQGLPTDTVPRDPDAPTGTVAVAIGPDGQPRFTICEGVAWDRIDAGPAELAAAAAADAVCFGSLAQRSERSRRAIRAVVSATRPSALRIFDVNIRPPFVDPEVVAGSLALANVLKLNDEELPRVADMLGLPGGTEERLAGLAARFELSLVVYTRGAGGSLLLGEGVWSDHPGFATEVSDTVGAGDAFTAVVATGLLRGWSLDEINRRANRVAAYVCSQPGATPPLPSALLES